MLTSFVCKPKNFLFSSVLQSLLLTDVNSLNCAVKLVKTCKWQSISLKELSATTSTCRAALGVFLTQLHEFDKFGSLTEGHIKKAFQKFFHARVY